MSEIGNYLKSCRWYTVRHVLLLLWMCTVYKGSLQYCYNEWLALENGVVDVAFDHFLMPVSRWHSPSPLAISDQSPDLKKACTES